MGFKGVFIYPSGDVSNEMIWSPFGNIVPRGLYWRFCSPWYINNYYAVAIRPPNIVIFMIRIQIRMRWVCLTALSPTSDDKKSKVYIIYIYLWRNDIGFIDAYGRNDEERGEARCNFCGCADILKVIDAADESVAPDSLIKFLNYFSHKRRIHCFNLNFPFFEYL